MLFEIACQNFFRDRCRPDPQNPIGSVAGLGGFSPTGDPATEPSGSTEAVAERVGLGPQEAPSESTGFKAQRLP